MKIVYFRIILLVVLGLCVVDSIQTPAHAAQFDEKEQILEIARQDPRLQDILADFEGLHMAPFWSERHNVWIIELMIEGREAGFVSVSLEEHAVLEFNFEVGDEGFEDEGRETDDEGFGFDEEGRGITSYWSVFHRFRPHIDGAALCWVTFTLTFIFLGDFKNIFSLRNLDIILLYSLCPFLNVIWQNLKIAYTGLFAVTFLFFLRCIAGAWMCGKPPSQRDAIFKRAALFVLILTILFHIQITYERPMDDSGLWSAIGASYWQKSGNLPYGTEFGHMGVYGPLLYAAHIPANLIFPPKVSFNKTTGSVEFDEYHQFDMRSAQSAVLVFDLLAILALYLFGKKYADTSTGLLLALVFALNPYVIGTGSGGLQWTSHIAAIPLVVFALVYISRPLLAGLLLGVGCGMLFYPIFLFPLWLGFYIKSTGRKDALKFIAGFALVGIVCLVMIMVLTEPGGEYTDLSPIKAFLSDTVIQQQFRKGYGTSDFSFWGQYPDISKWAKAPAGILFLLFCLVVGFMPRRIDIKRLVVLTAAVLVATQFVQSHGGGSYIGFYIAPFVITLFGLNGHTRQSEH